MWAHRKLKLGFTIVELLIVIAVIGILASVVIVTYTGSQGRARDATRINDIQNIQLAIESYINAKGYAPTFNGDCPAGASDPGCFANDMNSGYPWSQLQTELMPYMDKPLPVDPCGEACFNKQKANYYSDGFFTYRYSAPGDFDEGSSPKPIDYNIVAQNLESKAASYGIGFGSF